jgi:hypothetical protein
VSLPGVTDEVRSTSPRATDRFGGTHPTTSPLCFHADRPSRLLQHARADLTLRANLFTRGLAVRRADAGAIKIVACEVVMSSHCLRSYRPLRHVQCLFGSTMIVCAIILHVLSPAARRRYDSRKGSNINWVKGGRRSSKLELARGRGLVHRPARRSGRLRACARQVSRLRRH